MKYKPYIKKYTTYIHKIVNAQKFIRGYLARKEKKRLKLELRDISKITEKSILKK